MPENDLYKPLPPYHHGQRLRCIPNAALGKSDMPPGFKYAVEIPGDRRRGQLISGDGNLPLGVELEASFISHDGASLMLTIFSGVERQRSESDPDIKLMSFPVQGSLVSVSVVEKNAGGYIAEYRDYWGEGLRGHWYRKRCIRWETVLMRPFLDGHLKRSLLWLYPRLRKRWIECVSAKFISLEGSLII